MKLDAYDIQLIMVAKSDTRFRKFHVLRIWRERCGDRVPAMSALAAINWRLIEIVQAFELSDIRKVYEDFNPDRFFQLIPAPGGPVQKPWADIWFEGLMNTLMLSRVDQFPAGTFDGAQHVRDEDYV